tara:strand:- start:435 stop:932 length:498 start_codon:yes stop_codon:yes gene_type:complete
MNTLCLNSFAANQKPLPKKLKKTSPLQEFKNELVDSNIPFAYKITILKNIYTSDKDTVTKIINDMSKSNFPIKLFLDLVFELSKIQKGNTVKETEKKDLIKILKSITPANGLSEYELGLTTSISNKFSEDTSELIFTKIDEIEIKKQKTIANLSNFIIDIPDNLD